LVVARDKENGDEKDGNGKEQTYFHYDDIRNV
jgi:hypothetical protein